MIGSTIGPYTILSELGTGGMGTVYLGEADGKKTAIKIVHPHLIATPGFFKRFLREAELGKQVKHENVVRTLDVDATIVHEKQVNYMVMEYVEGRSLRGLLHDLGTVPETLLREIALQLAEGIAAIHAEGIVHRDLKPENVLITDDHRIRIMDLGVAKLQEASVALTKEGQFAGSFLYAAPEQFGSEPVGPAADLYSLGVMLHELATGENPFRRDDAAAVIQAHLSLEPPRVTDANPDLSPFLAEVTTSLLRKKAEDRLESATFLRELIDEGEESEWWAAREQELRKRETVLPKIRVRRETELHGRAGELEQMGQAWQRARDGQGLALWIEGEAGVGKTRLLDAFLRSLDEDDIHVLYGGYTPSGGLGGLSDAILGKFGASGLEESLAPYLSETPSLVPAFTALIRHETAPTGSELLQGDALHAVFSNLLRALAAEKPTIWIIDELHFAPSESRTLILSLARATEDSRCLLIGAARPGEDAEAENFARLENFRRIQLGRLSPREIIELVRDALRSEALANRLGAQIAYKSDGVPFFAFEIIRGLKESRFLDEQPDGTYIESKPISQIDVPSAVKDMIEARLRDLSRDERALLDVGSVLGYEFEPDLVARALERKRVLVLQDLAEIERRSGVIRAKGRNYCFDHPQLQEVLLDGISEGLREEYHTLVADAYADREELEEDDDIEGEDACFIAEHHLRGTRPKAARRYLDTAIDFLENVGRPGAAAELAAQALAAKKLLKGERRVAMLLRRARSLAKMGGSEQEREVLEEANLLADEIGDAALRARARNGRGSFHTHSGQPLDAVQDYEEASALAAQSGDHGAEASAQSGLAVVAWYLGRYEEMRDRLQRLLERVPEIGEGTELTATGNTGLALWDLGRYAEALDAYHRFAELNEVAANRQYEAALESNLGPIHLECGDVAGAREHLNAARRIAREMGFRRDEAYALHRLGDVAVQEGDEEEAVQLYRHALSMRRDLGHRSGEAESLLALGVLCKSQTELDEALALGREIDKPGAVVLALAYLALDHKGDVEPAREAFASLEERLRRREKMEAHFVHWKLTKNPEHLDAAHRLLEYLREHAPEEYRDTMIENVPLHRGIREAWNDRH